MDDVQKFSELLELLAARRINYVLVGGVAAALAGAPITTYDLDLIPDPDRSNLDRLVSLLLDLEASYADPAGRHISPNLERLQANRMNLFRTRLGRLDVAKQIGRGMAFEEAHRRSSFVQVRGVEVRILDLDALIESKEAADRPKDRAVLPILRETLRLSRARDQPPKCAE